MVASLRLLALLLLCAAAGCGGLIQPATSPPSYGHISGGGGA